MYDPSSCDCVGDGLLVVVVVVFLVIFVVGDRDCEDLELDRWCFFFFFVVDCLEDLFFLRFLEGDGDRLRQMCCCCWTLLLVVEDVRQRRAAVSCCFRSWSSRVRSLQVIYSALAWWILALASCVCLLDL